MIDQVIWPWQVSCVELHLESAHWKVREIPKMAYSHSIFVSSLAVRNKEKILSLPVKVLIGNFKLEWDESKNLTSGH